VKFRNFPIHLGLIHLSLAISLFFLISLGWFLPTYIYRYFTIAFMFSCLALSWDILGGYSGYLSFGHMSFFGVGAYTTAILLTTLGISPLITVPLGAFISGLLGVVSLSVFIRLEEAYFAIATLALNFSLQSLATVLEITGGARGISTPLLPFSPITLYIIFLSSFLVITMVLLSMRYKIENSRIGYAMLALREDKTVAECLGINTLRMKLIAMFISCFFTGLVGSMYPLFATFIDPTIGFSVDWSVLLVVMCICGGTGIWWGPLLGAFILHSVRELFTYTLPIPQLSLAIIGITFVILILFFPQGIGGQIAYKRRS